MKITKSIINEALKNVDFGSMRYAGTHYTPGKIVKINDKIIKGIKLGTQGPYSCFDNTEEKANEVINALKTIGFEVTFSDYSLVSLKTENWEITLVRQEHRTYESREMDPEYKTIYYSVRVSKI